MKRALFWGKVIIVLICLTAVPSLADKLTLPSGLKIIEEEAFYGDQNLDEVVLPDGVEMIGPKAFAQSSLKKINLPFSLADNSIADDAIDPGVTVTAEEGSWAYFWAVRNGFIKSDMNDNTVVFSGTITTSSGEPVNNVQIFASGKGTGRVNAVSNYAGQWKLSVVKSDTYTITYYHHDYLITGTLDEIVADEDHTFHETALAPLKKNNGIDFTMKQGTDLVSEIVVGTAVDFEVTMPENVSGVRLIVDGTIYETYPVFAGKAAFSRIFSSIGDGSRDICFQIWDENAWGAVSEAQILTITAHGNLDIPVIYGMDTVVNTDLSISWTADDRAQSYNVYVYAGGARVWPFRGQEILGRTENPYFVIPAEAFASSDVYTIQVVSTGMGYNSATGELKLICRDTNDPVIIINESDDPAEFGYGDTGVFRLESCFDQPTYSVKIMKPSDSQFDVYNIMEGHNSFEFQFTEVGNYFFAPVVSTSTGDYAEGTTIEISVDTPAVADFSVNGGHPFAWGYAGDTIHFDLIMNNTTPYCIALNEGNSRACLMEENGRHRYTADIKLSGEETERFYTVSMIDWNDPEQEIELGAETIPVFLISTDPDAGKEMVVINDTRLDLYPNQTSGITLSPGTIVRAANGIWNDTMRIIWYGNRQYFVDLSTVRANTTGNHNGILAVEENIGQDCIVNTSQSIEFSLYTTADVNWIDAVVYYSSPQMIADNGISESTHPCTQDINDPAKFTFSYPIEGSGKYYVQFIPHSSEMNTQILNGYTSPAFYAVQEVSPAYTLYLKDDYENRPVYKHPDMKGEETGIINWDESISVIGTMGIVQISKPTHGQFEILYITAETDKGTVRGFILSNLLQERMNQVEIRGYYLCARDIIVKYQNLNPSETGNNFRSLVEGMGGIYHNPRPSGITNEELKGVIREIAKTADCNDVTYIGLFAHGNVLYSESLEPVPDNEHRYEGVFNLSPISDEMNARINEMTRSEWRKMVGVTHGEFCDYLKDIPGDVVILMFNCHSGTMVDFLNDQEEPILDESRFTVIASVSADEKSVARANGEYMSWWLSVQCTGKEMTLAEIENDFDRYWLIDPNEDPDVIIDKLIEQYYPDLQEQDPDAVERLRQYHKKVYDEKYKTVLHPRFYGERQKTVFY